MAFKAGGLIALLLGLASCNFYGTACLIPPELTGGEMPSSDARFPAEEVEVIVDDLGVPHIYGQSPADVSYALGFMQGKDRQLQLWGFKKLLFGRGTEAFGEDNLEDDQVARMITYRVDDQTAAIGAFDHDLLEAFAAGVNDGVAWAGPTPEMKLQGYTFERWEPRDSIAIARYFGWSLSTGWQEELARTRIAARIPYDDPRYEELFFTGDSMGREVVRRDENSAQVGFGWPWLDDGEAPDPVQPRPWISQKPKNHPSAGPRGRGDEARTTPLWRQLMLGNMPLTQRGASNAWAVHGDFTTTGRAVHSHDPHLAHQNPGLFYLAHLSGPDFEIAGGATPGAPGIPIGHGKHVAFGVPFAPVDVMDSVRITPVPGRENDAYLLDGQEVEFEKLLQEYKDADGVVIHSEEWLITEFGPLLPDPMRDVHDEGELYALMWTGHDPIEGSGSIIGGIWDLGRAENVEEATAALQKVTCPNLNWTLAFADGTIAWRLGGDVPVRWSNEPTSWPRDGTSRKAGWAGRLPPEFKPQLTNPESGYIVAANQKIVGPTDPSFPVFRDIGSEPWRALRIDERIRELMAAGPVDPEDVWEIQMENTSYYARELSPVLGAHCPTTVSGFEASLVEAVCSRLRDFDGTYDLDNEGGLPFEVVVEALGREILVTHLGEDVGNQVYGDEREQLFKAYMRAHNGEEPAILDDVETPDYEGLDGMMARAMSTALADLTERAGEDPAGWRWGTNHWRQLTGPLEALPLVGGLLYNSQKFEEIGCSHCPRAERQNSSGRITSGAVLRLHTDATDPITAKITNDTGQSGHFGHWSFSSAYENWTNNTPSQLAAPRADVESRMTSRAVLTPKAAE